MKKLLLLVFLVFLVVLGQTAYSQTAADRAIFQEAEARFRVQDYELALDRYNALITRHPSSPHLPDAQFRRGVTLSRLGRHEEALVALRRVETRFRSTQFLEFVPFWQGLSNYHLGRHDDAHAAFTAFLVNRQNSELVRQALLYRALASSELDNPDAAIEDLSRLVSHVESPERESYAVASYLSLLLTEGRIEEGLRLAARLNLDEVDSAWASAIALYIGELLLRDDRPSEAESYYQRVLNTEPEAEARVVAPALTRLFQSALRAEDEQRMDELVRTAEQRLAAHPLLLSEFRQRAGVESYRADQKDRAESLLLRAWEMRSTVAPEGAVLLYLSETALERGETARARRYLEGFLEFGGADADVVLFRLAGLELSEQNWSRSAELFSEYQTQYPDSPRVSEAAYQQAFALYRAGSLEEAEQVLLQVGSLPGEGVPSWEIRRLNASILRGQGRVREATENLELYLRDRPESIDARFEYLKLLFRLERYGDVVDQAEIIRANAENRGQLDAAARFELRYLTGLAHTAERQYRDSLMQLSGLAESIASADNGESLRLMIPYARYYTGWALYRLAEYSEAIREFELMINAHPDHELAPRAGYLAGWSAYSLAEYQRAEGLLRPAFTQATTDVQRAEILFLLGQALAADARYTEAAVEFRTVTQDYSESGIADHAQFEYAGVLQAQGRLEAAAGAYQAVYDRYPDSGVAGRALYNRGELFFQAERYADARQAYLEYRRAFPEGGLFDAALYWGGVASSRLGEPAGALLLWNQLINEYRESSFRADAMIQTARLHESRRDYRSALNMLTQLLVAYPEQAATAQARRRADELVLLIGGIGEREASLLVRVESGNRAATPEGRAAILELGRSVLVEGLGGVSLGLIIPMLHETAAVAQEDPSAAAEALYLLGEHARSVGEEAAAAEYYLEAAAVDPANADRTARSLFRAGEAYQRMGRRPEVVALLNQLEESFPNSSWTEQARRVLGGQ